jgi:hypothetical protein
MKVFKDLLVWQKAHALTLAIYRSTQRFPKEEMYGLTEARSGAHPLPLPPILLKDVVGGRIESSGVSSKSPVDRRANSNTICFSLAIYVSCPPRTQVFKPASPRSRRC